MHRSLLNCFLAILCTFFLCFPLPAAVRMPRTENVQVTTDTNKVSLKEVLLQLQKAYKVNILFEDAVVNKYLVPASSINEKLSLEVNLNQILDQINFSPIFIFLSFLQLGVAIALLFAAVLFL